MPLDIKIKIIFVLLVACCWYFFLYFQLFRTNEIYLDPLKKDFNCKCSISSMMAIKSKSKFAERNQVTDNPLQESLCSSDATALGPHQKVISFSLFLYAGNENSSITTNSFHFKGITKKAKELQKFYPGWKIRIYTYSHRHFNKQLCELTCTYPNEIFLCDIEKLPRFGNISYKVDAILWRLIPLFDPTVDIFISRDLDSRFSDRELAAVNEWIKSNKTFHSMRDHPWHPWSMMGGMWGAKTNRVNISMKTKYEEAMLKYGTSGYFVRYAKFDQRFLDAYIYPTIKEDLMSHDSYFCQSFKEAVPFPVKRKDSTDFVGNFLFSPKRHPISTECPIECRPLYGKDWEFC